MKNLVTFTLSVLFLSACAAPTEAPRTFAPASSPSNIPAPTAAPARTLPPNSGITIRDAQQVTKSDGTVNATGNIATQDNLGLGQLELNYPNAMLSSDTRQIILRVTPAKQFAASTPVAAPQALGTPTLIYVFSGNLQLYPVMIAQLRALAFEMDPTGPVRRAVDGTKEISWVWIVHPRNAGRHDLSIEISIPAINNGAATEITTDVLQNIPLSIQVNAPPAPTATPVSLLQRVGDSLLDNSGAIIVALIGAIATLIGIWLKARSDKASKG